MHYHDRHQRGALVRLVGPCGAHVLHGNWLASNHSLLLHVQKAGPNHYWIPGTDVPRKFELGGPAHEGCAGIVALSRYFQFMAAQSPGMRSVHTTLFVTI